MSSKSIKAVSDLLQIAAWLVCVAFGWLSIVDLTFFGHNGGWALIGICQMAIWIVPASSLMCIVPLGYLAFVRKRPRDRKSFWIASVPLLTFTIETVLALYLDHGGGS